ncbi:hypothetical protein HK100_001583 [Physocladia obscura]|uniref:Uncharacterized protein n=1 Tax=Physocladia obscura TaxID=109957 RepID=A0AAD5SY78_9FUNG|nr:hypothetical protein HK100_001583 [Physocladia obscura]
MKPQQRFGASTLKRRESGATVATRVPVQTRASAPAPSAMIPVRQVTFKQSLLSLSSSISSASTSPTAATTANQPTHAYSSSDSSPMQNCLPDNSSSPAPLPDARADSDPLVERVRETLSRSSLVESSFAAVQYFTVCSNRAYQTYVVNTAKKSSETDAKNAIPFAPKLTKRPPKVKPKHHAPKAVKQGAHFAKTSKCSSSSINSAFPKTRASNVLQTENSMIVSSPVDASSSVRSPTLHVVKRQTSFKKLNSQSSFIASLRTAASFDDQYQAVALPVVHLPHIKQQLSPSRDLATSQKLCSLVMSTPAVTIASEAIWISSTPDRSSSLTSMESDDMCIVEQPKFLPLARQRSLEHRVFTSMDMNTTPNTRRILEGFQFGEEFGLLDGGDANPFL